MAREALNISGRFEWLVLLAFAVCAVLMLRPESGERLEFNSDDLRYINYAVSLHEHGVFGLSGPDITQPPVPGNANAPLYPMMMAGVMALDSDFAQSLKCVAEKGEDENCSQNFQSFFAVQIGLSILCLFFIYLTAFCFSQSKVVAWVSVFLALASGIFTEFSYIFMTEILILPAFAALLLFTLLSYKHEKLRYVVGAALCLSVLTLIRPSYLYLFYGFAGFFMLVWAAKRNRQSAKRLALLVLVFVLGVSPWALRNKIQFNDYTLTTGGYAEAILVQRVNYNQMSWPEVGAAMIYWLPDFGDSVAKKLFPGHLHSKLGWSDGSYYAQGYHDQIQNLSEELGGTEKILKHLIVHEVMTPKHIAVSIPLSIRGAFIAKYFGFLGFIAFIALLVQTLRRGDYALAVISLPLLYMVAFHAGLSVSIPRYNLPLVTLYALSMAWYINFYGHTIASKINRT